MYWIPIGDFELAIDRMNPLDLQVSIQTGVFQLKCERRCLNLEVQYAFNLLTLVWFDLNGVHLTDTTVHYGVFECCWRLDLKDTSGIIQCHDSITIGINDESVGNGHVSGIPQAATFIRYHLEVIDKTYCHLVISCVVYDCLGGRICRNELWYRTGFQCEVKHVVLIRDAWIFVSRFDSVDARNCNASLNIHHWKGHEYASGKSCGAHFVKARERAESGTIGSNRCTLSHL